MLDDAPGFGCVVHRPHLNIKKMGNTTAELSIPLSNPSYKQPKQTQNPNAHFPQGLLSKEPDWVDPGCDSAPHFWQSSARARFTRSSFRKQVSGSSFQKPSKKSVRGWPRRKSVESRAEVKTWYKPEGLSSFRSFGCFSCSCLICLMSKISIHRRGSPSSIMQQFFRITNLPKMGFGTDTAAWPRVKNWKVWRRGTGRISPSEASCQIWRVRLWASKLGASTKHSTPHLTATEHGRILGSPMDVMGDSTKIGDTMISFTWTPSASWIIFATCSTWAVSKATRRPSPTDTPKVMSVMVSRDGSGKSGIHCVSWVPHRWRSTGKIKLDIIKTFLQKRKKNAKMEVIWKCSSV